MQANTSWTRENSKNDFLYNAGSELNTTSGWYETFYRNYDPALGRFTSIDPLATKYASVSGYHYAGNNPVMLNDPTGAYWNGYEEQEGYNGPSGCNTCSADYWYAYDQQMLNADIANFYAKMGVGNPGNWEAQGMAQYHIQRSQLLRQAQNGDVNAARAYAAMNGDLQTVHSAGDNRSTIIYYTVDGVTYIDVYVDPRVQQLQTGPQDPWPKTAEIHERWRDSWRNDFVNPLVEKYNGTSFDPRDLVNEIESFNFSKLKDSKGTGLTLRPVFGRLAVQEAPGTPYSFSETLFDVPDFLRIRPEYAALNPGMEDRLIYITNNQGHLAAIVIRMELVFPQ